MRPVLGGLLLLAVFVGTIQLVFGDQLNTAAGSSHSVTASVSSLIPVLSPTDYTEARWNRLRDVFRRLAETSTGKKILSQAGEMVEQVRWGNVSKTDAVLTRQFDPTTGIEKRVREVTVYLKETQTIEESILDLAHEMTHAMAGPQWDPYDPNLTASNYVHAIIDASGGEVDALTTECRVALELSDMKGTDPGRCTKYSRSTEERVSRAEILKDFYRVGRWKGQVAKALEQSGVDTGALPLLSGEEAVFFSSTGKTPYPIALLREFAELNNVACGNTVKRLSTMSSSTDQNPQTIRDSTVRFLRKRCPGSVPELSRRFPKLTRR